MAAKEYIWEKVTVAVICLCAEFGSFEERLHNAYDSALALAGLEPKDTPQELAEDLNWVLELCRGHEVPEEGRMRTILETDRRKLVEKLVHLLIQTSRMT